MKRITALRKWMLLAIAVTSGISVLLAGAQSPPQAQSQSAATHGPQPNYLPRRAKMYYQTVWGVDSFRVKWSESGEIVRFTWRVVDPQRAAALNDKKAEPQLLDPQAGVSLVVPAVSNVGKLRQTSTPKAGMTYWMAFSNVGRRVKRGDRVDVVIGHFRAQGLVVE
jgi:hypothetical protein